MKKLNAHGWNHEVGDGKKLVEYQLVLPEASEGVQVTLLARAKEPIAVFGVDPDGQSMFFAFDQVIDFRYRLEGFVALELQCVGPMAYSLMAAAVRGSEVLDLTPVAVTFRNNERSHLRRIAELEVQRVIGAMRKAGQLPDEFDEEQTVEEVLRDDFGDDFWDDDDPETPFMESPDDDDEDISESADAPAGGESASGDPSPDKGGPASSEVPAQGAEPDPA